MDIIICNKLCLAIRLKRRWRVNSWIKSLILYHWPRQTVVQYSWLQSHSKTQDVQASLHLHHPWVAALLSDDRLGPQQWLLTILIQVALYSFRQQMETHRLMKVLMILINQLHITLTLETKKKIKSRQKQSISQTIQPKRYFTSSCTLWYRLTAWLQGNSLRLGTLKCPLSSCYSTGDFQLW